MESRRYLCSIQRMSWLRSRIPRFLGSLIQKSMLMVPHQNSFRASRNRQLPS